MHEKKIVLLHSIIKKTEETPNQDLNLAKDRAKNVRRTMRRKKTHNYIGSSLDDFLREEGLLEHCEEVGAKYAFTMQLKDEMEKQKVSRENLAQRMHTSRSAVDRILDPNKSSTLKSFYKAALAVGRPLRINLG